MSNYTGKSSHMIKYGVHPASYSVGTAGSFPGVKQPGHGDDHSLPSSVEDKNGGAILPLPHIFSWHSA